MRASLTVTFRRKRRPDADRWFLHPPRALALAASVGVLATAVAYVVDQAVVHLGDPEGLLLWWNDAIIGLLSFFVALVLLLVDGRAHRRGRARLEVIREVHHHVGNALQVVRLHQAIEGDPEMTAQVDDAIDRIEWVLREVLPHVNAPDAPRAVFTDRFPWRGSRRRESRRPSSERSAARPPADKRG